MASASAARPPSKILLLCWSFGLRQWRMEKDLCHLLPGMRNLVHVYHPVMRGKAGNGANGEGSAYRKNVE